MVAFVTTADAYNKTKTFAKISMTATNYNVCKINPDICNKLRWLQQTRMFANNYNHLLQSPRFATNYNACKLLL